MPPKRRKTLAKDNLEEVYPEDADLIRDLKQTCLEVAKTDAKALSRTFSKENKLQTGQKSNKWLKLSEGISEDSLTVYKKWKAEQTDLLTKSGVQLPKVSVCNLLVLLHVLKNAKDSPEVDAEVKLYLQNAQRHYGLNPFWCSPCIIIAAFRQCILTRNWDKLTLFCIALLKQNFVVYDTYVRKVCRLMIKQNPLIPKSGLLDQFVMLLGINKTPF